MKNAKHIAEMAVEYGFAYKDMKAGKYVWDYKGKKHSRWTYRTEAKRDEMIRPRSS